MKVDVLLGLQWGDEGKGKIVDVLTPDYNIIARFQGGPNAGHSLEFHDIKHVLHTIPSGIFRAEALNVIGNGVVIDPAIFKKEIEGLKQFDIDLTKSLFISKRAHLIMPSHRILDAASEAAKGKTKIGSTLKGIGPAYMDKTGRNGLRVGDTLAPDFEEKYRFLKEKNKQILRLYDYQYDIEQYEREWLEGVEMLKRFNIVDTEHFLNRHLEENKRILAEGAQGTLLDIDFGTYPYVTSSNTVAAGACIGLGIAPNKIGKVFGIFKAYCTRVGSGPFPTELHDADGEKLQKHGDEFGATTGRPRRCGWLDLPALKYAVMINGVTDLIMTKADILSHFERFKVAVAYHTEQGKELECLPYSLEEKIEPVYKEFPGWNCDIAEISNESDFPPEFKTYIQFIENQVGAHITIISVGPNRNSTIIR